jgi:hypothetical protein
VSLDGTLFKPNGTFQGGRSGNLDARAGRWDDQLLEKLRAERDALREQLEVRVFYCVLVLCSCGPFARLSWCLFRAVLGVPGVLFFAVYVVPRSKN